MLAVFGHGCELSFFSIPAFSEATLKKHSRKGSQTPGLFPANCIDSDASLPAKRLAQQRLVVLSLRRFGWGMGVTLDKAILSSVWRMDPDFVRIHHYTAEITFTGAFMRDRHFISAFMIALLFAVVMIGPSGECQAQTRARSPHGTYLVKQDDGYMVLLTLSRDGNAFIQQSGQFEHPGAFADQQGSWKRTEDGRILIRTLDFTRNTKTGVFTGYGRCFYTARFKANGTVAGKFMVEIFPKNADPLDLSPSNRPVETFGPIGFTGRRITVR
jgi:hypothetical protein